MNFETSVRTCFRKYIDFNGRATRPEYWYFVLFIVIVGLILALVDGMIFGFDENSGQPISLVFSLATFLPSLAVAIRRLHDTGRRGWWMFIVLIPIVGAIVLLVFFVSKSEEGANDHGPDPHKLWA